VVHVGFADTVAFVGAEELEDPRPDVIVRQPLGSDGCTQER
jgi:hypothetical protein